MASWRRPGPDRTALRRSGGPGDATSRARSRPQRGGDRRHRLDGRSTGGSGGGGRTMTALAPLPGRETGPDGEGEAATGAHDVVVLPDTADSTTTTPLAATDTSATKTVSVHSGDST